LVDNLSKTLQSDESDQRGTVESDNGFGIEVCFSFESEDFTRELNQALREIVRERNDLIHKRLISFDPHSVENCRDLIRELDEQRARIKPQFEAVSAICLNLRDFFKQLKDYSDSESFADDLKRVKEQGGDSSAGS
jgi:predicted nuclease with TOPRIM domain